MKITKMQDISSADRSVKMVIFGSFGIGKTSLLKTLEELTLYLDFEAGLLSVQDWDGDVLAVQTWEEARDLACLICGVSPAVRADKFYGKRHHEYCLKKYGFAENLKRYKCIFIDSITVASRLCLEYAKSMSDVVKTGKPDVRAAYGLMATEILSWINHFQHLQGVDVIFVGGLDQKQDDFNRTVYSPQVEGSKVSSELPGILDEVITMTTIQGGGSTAGMRKFVCQTINPDGYPAKDRSGKFNVFEDANLGKLLRKIKGHKEQDEQFSDIKQAIKQISDLSLKGEQK
jgi:hypothetical protein